MFLVFGTLGLVLCASGIYGVVSYALSRRRHEIGNRMTLGAQRGQVLGLAIRGAMTPVLIGFVLGLAGAAIVTRLIASQLHGIRPFDSVTLTLVLLILGGVAVLAYATSPHDGLRRSILWWRCGTSEIIGIERLRDGVIEGAEGTSWQPGDQT